MGLKLPLREKFENQQHSAYTKLIMSISTPMVALCQTCVTAVDVWTTLTKKFDKNTNLSKLRIKKEHIAQKLREGESAKEHIRLMKELTDQLAIMGSPVFEEEQSMIMLLSLPPSYSTLVTTLSTELDMTKITNGILEFEYRTKSVEQYDIALYGSAHKPHNKGGNQKSIFPCFNCNKTGHFGRDCKEPRNSAQMNSRPQPRNRRPPQRGVKSHKAKIVTETNYSHSEFAFCATTGDDQTRRSDWIIDSGASCHMCWERDVFLTHTKLSGSNVKLGDGRNVKAAGEGTVKLKVHCADGKEVTLKLHRVLHVPEMSVNLLSVKDVTDQGFRLMFTENCCQIQTEHGKLVAEGVKRGNLYLFDGKSECTGNVGEAHVANVTDRELWHYCLGHISDMGLDKLCGGRISTGVVIKDVCERAFCEGCAKGKQTRSTPKPLRAIHAMRRLERIHSDVCGPVNVASLTGKRYVITCTDDKTHRSDVMFMTQKSQGLDFFKEYQALVEVRLVNRLESGTRTEEESTYARSSSGA